MKFLTLISTALTSISLASAIRISYDPIYDDSTRALTAVSCSDGPNGLITKYKWNTFADIPKFPYVGGYDGIPGWNSDQCGKCYSLTYNSRTIYVLTIDHAGQGFNIATAALNDLTDGQAVSLGVVDAAYASVDPSFCGL